MLMRVLSVFILFFLGCKCDAEYHTIGYYTETGRDREASGSGENERKTDFKTWLKSQPEIEEEIEGEDSCVKMRDLVIILDGSPSIGPIGFRTIKSYAKRILNEVSFTECDNVGIIKFTEFANSEKYLASKDTKANIFDRIDSLEEPESFDVFEVNNSRVDLALLVAEKIVFTMQLGSRPTSEKFLVLMTDGKQPKHDSYNRSATIKNMVRELSNKGIRILVLAVGQSPNIDELLRLTRDEKYIFPERRLSDLIDVIVPKRKHPNLINLTGADFFVDDEFETDDDNDSIFGH